MFEGGFLENEFLQYADGCKGDGSPAYFFLSYCREKKKGSYDL